MKHAMIGCLAALRLSERLLHAYWLSLLLLFVGDLLVSLLWMLSLPSVLSSTKAALVASFEQQFNANTSELLMEWQRLEQREHCCGLNSALDYNLSSWQDLLASNTTTTSTLLLPHSCCPMKTSVSGPLVLANTIKGRLLAKQELLEPPSSSNLLHELREREEERSMAVHEEQEMAAWCTYGRGDYWRHGCLDELVHWMEESANQVVVVALCVAAFLKITFLGLMRVEMREMLEKIRLIRSEEQLELVVHNPHDDHCPQHDEANYQHTDVFNSTSNCDARRSLLPSTPASRSFSMENHVDSNKFHVVSGHHGHVLEGQENALQTTAI